MNKIGIAFIISFLLFVNCKGKSLEEDLKSTTSNNKQNLISNEKKSLNSKNNRLKDSRLSNFESKKKWPDIKKNPKTLKRIYKL